jgi:homospermidine synthase
MKNLGVKGIHIAERDTQTSGKMRPEGELWNTWSVDGFIS